MTRKLTTTGLFIALAVILSMLRLFDMPYGGSVTPASMLPIIMLSLLYGTKWGVLSGILFALLSILFTGLPAPPVQNAASYLLVFFLDYILAFGLLGTASLFYKLYGKKPLSVPFAAATVIFLRFLCHFASGVFIWSAYAWEGYGAVAYSFLYNGGYMLFELLITSAAAFGARFFLQKQL